MSEIFESREQLIDWATGAGLRILVAVVAGIIASLLVQRLIRAAVRPRMLAPSLSDERDDERLRRREQTVESCLIRTSNTFITFATGMVALAELGVNVAPLIASAGIVGLAIGFGAQTLVKDAIAGVFLLLESHYDIGDRVKLGSAEGEVIGVSLRRTTLRYDAGGVHTIPNGSITVTSNLTEVARDG